MKRKALLRRMRIWNSKRRAKRVAVKGYFLRSTGISLMVSKENASVSKYTFAEWYERQHGRRPSVEEVEALMARAVSFEVQAGQLRDLAQRSLAWDQRLTSAQWAWNIAEADKLPGKTVQQ